MTDLDARRLMRLHLDQALAIAISIDETLLAALIAQAADYCDASGAAPATAGVPTTLLQ